MIPLIEEEKPFLVAGYSELKKDWVFGFPYFYKVSTGEGTCTFCPCILLPAADDGVSLPDDSEFDFAVKQGEFHPINGKLYPFVREEDDRYVFSCGIDFKIK